MSQSDTILVTGASGHLGRLVIERLLKTSKGQKIIATTRDPQKLSDLAKKGVEVRAADFADPASLRKAFTGATSLLLISTDAVGTRVEQHKSAIEAAKAVGVKHIAYTSWLNPDRSAAAVAPDHLETEKAIEASGLAYTILRNNFYADNLLGSLKGTVESGSLIGATAGGKISYVTREDCANAAAGALTSSSKFNAVYDITGPEALSHEDVAKIVSRIAGKEIKSVDVTPADLTAGMVKHGLPDFVANLLTSFDLAIKQGAAISVSNSVKLLSGSEPQSLEAFLTANKASFV